MLKNIFIFCLKYPKSILASILLISIFFASYIPKLEIDASSETLMLNDDKDLIFSRKVAKTFQTSDYLVVTFSPKDSLLSQKSLDILQNLTRELERLDFVKSTISILNVPLLQSPVRPISELLDELKFINSKDVNKTLAKKEFTTSPLYKNNLVSEDFSTTAIVLNLKTDKKYFELLKQRNALLNKELNASQKLQLQHVKELFKAHRDKQRQQEHQNIQNIKDILSKYSSQSQVFLGGVSMIANDMIDYVKNDVLLYGLSLLALLIFTLGIIFRQLRWVVIPIIICATSVVITAGLLGLLGLEITVISSNFISLQLIITLSIALHLIVQYQEYAKKYKKTNQKRLLLLTILDKLNPSFFAIITTIAGFFSLILSDILPIINLGIMMSVGISISLVISFLLFTCINANLTPLAPKNRLNIKFSLTNLCAKIVQKFPKSIIVVSLIFVFLSILGATKLQVENSFINYFLPSTQIYKGMRVIDQKLGGTTPLDVIITFKEEKAQEPLNEFEEEFTDTSDEYWFSSQKIQLIQKVSKYLNSIKQIGNVQSFDTILQIGKSLNNDKQLGSFELAILYKQLPHEYKKILIDPYINVQKNQARFVARIVDSNPDLRRDLLLKQINHDLKDMMPPHVEVRLSSFMVLYNNMLQSLYSSQILTLGFVIAILTLMFWILFRSLKVALIAIISNLIPMSTLFGFMGLANIPLDMMSITIAAISIGIGVDDTIHYIHRFKQEFDKTKNYQISMMNSHKSIGYAMFYTSIAIILGFSVLVVSNFIPTIYFGLLTVYVMIMVLLGALLLLPRLLIMIKPYGKQNEIHKI